jgi:malonate-semialdehyde dehydrogenase (acetylating)/methylmalonate-semialdehyde dehydrogenase
VGDALVAKLKQRLAHLKVGPGTLPGMDMGPLVTRAHYEKVRGYVDLGVEEGAELVVDGRGLTVPGHEEGFFLGGCLFDRVLPSMRVYNEEIFGPVLCVVRVKSQEEAMALIDAHEYGNGTCIFTRDGEAARYFTDNIKVGMVGVNVAAAGAGGDPQLRRLEALAVRRSLRLRPDSVRFYTRRKTVTQRWPAGGVRELAQFAFPSNA